MAPVAPAGQKATGAMPHSYLSRMPDRYCTSFQSAGTFGGSHPGRDVCAWIH